KFCGREADFSGANLTRADLTGGRLTRAKFVGADLTDADLTGADLIGADFTDANLTNATLAELVFDRTTVWPEGFVVPHEARWSPFASGSRAGGGDQSSGVNIDRFMARLHQSINANRMVRTMEMLKSGTNQLFAEVEA